MISHIGSSSTVYEFRQPEPQQYLARFGLGENLPTNENAEWIHVHPAGRPDQSLDLGRRLLLTPAEGKSVQDLVRGRPLGKPWEILPGTWVTEAPDAWIAAEEAIDLCRSPDVVACHPAMRFPLAPRGLYAPAPNDPYFTKQWHLENRAAAGDRAGADVNAREAWSKTRGEGVLAAIVDDGVELTHPDLSSRFEGGPHFNFGDQTPNGGPSTPTASHSTAVAGILGATAGNHRGVSGVAPGVKMTSWVIFQGSLLGPDTVGMKSMFESKSNSVPLQNHSWGAGGTELYPLPPLENAGISNAVTAGRSGKGVVMVRAASNWRSLLGDANADGYASDPRVITVAAARSDGRVARYSNPGSCLLVAGLGGETDAASGGTDLNFPTITTTDLTGLSGKNQIFAQDDAADYRYDATGFSGTSAATPMVSGVVALMLSVNPALSYRDVQQILALSSRHIDLDDPWVQTNGAGLRVSYNLGFGVPDAGVAVRRAQTWPLKAPLRRLEASFPTDAGLPVVDDGLRVEVVGDGIPPALSSIPVSAGTGPQPEQAIGPFPVANVGAASGESLGNLAGKAALILRGGNNFADKINKAALANASVAIVYNNSGFTDRMVMQNTDFSKIPGLFMSKSAGDQLAQLLATNSSARIRVNPIKTATTLKVTNTWICEHVGARIKSDHTRRGDLRITLVSPSGTRSVLQSINQESHVFPATGWTYYSTHCFFEPSFGTWRLEVIDEEPGNSGALLKADLIIHGIPIVDTDCDGLEDAWELARFGDLTHGPAEDPDRDGMSNAMEQAVGGNPLGEDAPFLVDLSPWNRFVVRLSWPGTLGAVYQVLSASDPAGPYLPAGVVSGDFPTTEWFTPQDAARSRLFQVRRLSQ
ncbi:MAG: S8 family serine peptidase [Verrucomicrobia bacterium]|nr:S8 family serine peptidase [Verrucomicrobiota bacterium]MBI3868470.1 S8 family serine peptidase [Verrucomicrobiota bacterium]